MQNIIPVCTYQEKNTMRTRLCPKSICLAIIATACMALSSSAHGQPNPPLHVPKANLAQGAEVSVSSEQSGFPKAHAVDGNCSTEWASTGGHPWIALHWK
jgi:hypothetical protein